MFKRDKIRFNQNLDLIDESPLGAAALSGTSYILIEILLQKN